LYRVRQLSALPGFPIPFLSHRQRVTVFYEESIALVFQIVALDQIRFRHQIGLITEHQRLAIVALIRDLLKLD